jgi:N-acetylneuraminate lyase
VSQHIVGLVAAPYTPMRDDGSLNLGSIEKLAERLVRHGVQGAFVCGSTGEGLSLSTEERKQIAARWVEAAGDRLKVIVHAGHAALPDACELAAHAERIGAYAVAAVPPFYFRPASVPALVDCLSPIAAAAPDLPFYCYHIPPLTHVDLPMPEFLRLGAERIPNLQGIKYSKNDLMEYQQCLRFEDGRFDILWGSDEILLSALVVGAEGAVGSTYNHSAGLFHRMIAALAERDLTGAQARAWEAVELVSAMVESGSVLAAGKALLTRLGVPSGPPRPPMRPLAPEQADRLFERLTARGILDLP